MKYCFRCGDLNHLANSFRDPVRCFACGSFGHKCKGYGKNLVSVNNSNLFSYTSSISINNGFQFVLKFLKLREVLLDTHWFMEDEGIRYLDELLYHFNNINEPNIGKRYRERFGNPEVYFSKASTGVFKKQIVSSNSNHRERGYSSPSLVNHGFQFMLKYLILRGLLIDYLWFEKAVGISYPGDLFYHFDIINEPNIGKWYNENSVDFGGKSEVSCN